MTRCILAVAFSFSLFLSQPLWIFRYSEPGTGNGNSQSNSVVYGADSNIYAGGISRGFFTGVDQIIISLQPNNELNWVYRYDSVRMSDVINQIACSSDSNICSAGYIHGTYEQYFCVQSVSRAGTQNWMYTIAGSGECSALAIDCDTDGNVFAAGFVCRPYNVWDYTVVGLDTAGTEKWLVFLDGANDYDAARSIVYCPDGNVYSAGYTLDTIGHPVFSVARHNSQNGNTSWIDHYTPGNARKIICDNNSNVYALGTLNDMCAIRKYNSSGSIAWTRTIDAGIATITYGADDNIYGAGHQTNAGTDDDLVVFSLTSTNILNWMFTYSDSGDSRANAVVCGLDGNIYVGGYVTGSNSMDAMVLSLSALGDTEWTYQYNGPGNEEDCILDITYGQDYQLYASGYSCGSSAIQDLIVMCFNTLDVRENDTKPVFLKNLMTVEPNPCSQAFKISLNLAKLEHPVSLKLYDVTGRTTCTLMDNQIFIPCTIVYDLPPDLPTGIYYLVLQTGASQYLQKVVVIQQ